MTFEQTYPTTPPLIRICSPFPSPNILDGLVCLDMLTPVVEGAPAGKPYRQWSAAFSVVSILRQLQLLLDYEWASDSEVERALREARGFTCGVCGHCAAAPSPAFVTARLAAAPERVITTDLLQLVGTRRSFRRSAAKRAGGVVFVNNAKAPAGSAPAASAPAAPLRPNESGWILVKRAKAGAVVPADKAAAPAAPLLVAENRWSVLSTFASASDRPQCSACGSFSLRTGFSNSQLAKSPNVRKCKNCVASDLTAGCAAGVGGNLLSKSARKNMARAERRRQCHKSELSNKLQEEGHSVEQKKEQAGSSVVAEWKAGWDQTRDTSLGGSPLRLLDRDSVLGVMSFLTTGEVASFSSTCRVMSVSGDDGALWKLLFSRLYPSAALRAGSLSAWKTSFVLQRNQAAESMTCFFTKRPHQEVVIGVPITYTVNPKTREKDYITSSHVPSAGRPATSIGAPF